MIIVIIITIIVFYSFFIFHLVFLGALWGDVC